MKFGDAISPYMLASMVTDAAEKYLQVSPAPHMDDVDLRRVYEDTISRCFDPEDNSVAVFGDFAFLFGITRPWHSRKRALVEDLLIRFRREVQNDLDEVLESGIPALARQLGVSRVFVGDTQAGLMEPRYIRAGYTPLGTQLMREV